MDEFQMNCMTLIAGKSVSDTGYVLIAHNEDDPGHTAVRHAYVPARNWPEGTMLPAEEGCARIPQVPHTFGYFWTEYKKENGGLSTADSFVNENGVVIVSNSMMRSKEDDADAGLVRDGGIGYNLRRVLAERSRSARHGAELLREMIETWGYAFSGRAYTIADKDEAFQFQLVRGRHYVGARVPDDAVVVMPNHYNFHALTDLPEMFYPEDIVSYAVEKGWYTPACEGDTSDFDFALAYQHDEDCHAIGNMLRQKNGQSMVLGRPWDIEAEGTPFAIYPREKMNLRKFVEVLSTHYEGTPDDCEHFGPGRSPHYVPSARRICTGTTLECDVYAFGERPELLTLYAALGRPCELPFLPLHPLCGVPEVLLESIDPFEMMANHLSAEPSVLDWSNATRQQLRDVECAIELCYSDVIGDLRPMLRNSFDDAMRESAEVVCEISGLYALGKKEEASAFAREKDGAFAAKIVRVMQDFAKAHASNIKIEPLSPISLGAYPEILTLTLHTSLDLKQEEMVFGVEHTDVRQHYAPAQALRKTGEGTFEADFPTANFRRELQNAGCKAFWLGGRDANDAAFAAMIPVKIH